MITFMTYHHMKITAVMHASTITKTLNKMFNNILLKPLIHSRQYIAPCYRSLAYCCVFPVLFNAQTTAIYRSVQSRICALLVPNSKCTEHTAQTAAIYCLILSRANSRRVPTSKFVEH